MTAPVPDRVITATEAAGFAGITYRQLDHWARKGWVVPSVRKAAGRGGRRLYAADDICRLAALKHFGQSGWGLNEIGGLVGSLDLSRAEYLVVGSATGVAAVRDQQQLLQTLAATEQFSVYALGDLRSVLSAATSTTNDPTSLEKTA